MTIHLCHHSRQLGAFSKEQVKAMLKAGVINDGTQAWSSGLAEWKTLREILDATTPPTIPPPQIVASSTPGSPPGISTPVDTAQRIGFPPPPSVHPIIAMPPFVQQEILKLAHLGFGQFIAWILFILGIGVNGVNVGSSLGEPNAVASLLMFVCGIFVLRSWFKRRTLRTILKQDSLQRVYWPAFWSFAWRCGCMAIVVAFLFGYILHDGSPDQKLTSFLFVVFAWMLISMLTLDVPYRCCRRVNGILKTHHATTLTHTQCNRQDMQGGPISVAPVAPSSWREITSPTLGNKWIVGLSVVFGILSVIAVAWESIYVRGHPNTNRDAVATGRQNGPLTASGGVESTQSASDFTVQKSGQTPAADPNPPLPEKRLGDLFPSITKFGNPQYVINWKNIDPTAEYDEPFEFVDYPARTGFILPPTDITVPIYSPAIGPVVESVSSMHLVHSPCDCIVYYTDTRPSACVVWVSRTNTDSASVSLCADFAVFTACAIAGKQKYMRICEGGGWRRSPSTGGALVYMPVLFYTDMPSIDANIKTVQEVRSRVTKTTDTLINFLNAVAADEAKHSTKKSTSP